MTALEAERIWIEWISYFFLMRPMSVSIAAYLPFHSLRNLPKVAPSIQASEIILSLQYFLKISVFEYFKRASSRTLRAAGGGG